MGLRTKAPHGVEYQWIDMLIYGVLMMTYPLMAMAIAMNVASTKHQCRSEGDSGRACPHVAFVSGMVDGRSKVGHARPHQAIRRRQRRDAYSHACEVVW